MNIKIFIAGSGGIGTAAGLILAEAGWMDTSIYFGDIYLSSAEAAVRFVEKGSTSISNLYAINMPAEGSNDEVDKALEVCDVVLDCLPGDQAPRMARLARKFNCHYANLTERVYETNEIMKIAEGADTCFVLQTGLAPGFINVLAVKLYEEFQADFGVDTLEKMEMKVGALSQHTNGPHFYAFTWSPLGVATEYVRDAIAVRDFKTINIPALSGVNEIIIDGNVYEDNYTSGGAADLPEAFAGKIKDIDYKTLRYPGHYGWVKETLDAIPNGSDKISTLEKEMLDNIPSVEDDVVIVYAAVTGKDSRGRLRKKERSYEILPSVIGKQKMRAIQTTTAAPMCEMVRMMITNRWKGVKLQSQIDSDEFLNGPFVSMVYGKY